MLKLWEVVMLSSLGGCASEFLRMENARKTLENDRGLGPATQSHKVWKPGKGANQRAC
jgi:hypothetical protein